MDSWQLRCHTIEKRSQLSSSVRQIRPSMRISRILWALACVVAGGLAGQVLYRGAIIPRLSGWRAIPLAWYPALALPLLLGFLAAGVLLRPGREATLAAGLLALLALLPGGHDADPALNVMLSFVLAAVCLNIVAWLATRFRVRRASV